LINDGLGIHLIPSKGEYQTLEEAQQVAARTEIGSKETCYYRPPVNVESRNNNLFSLNSSTPQKINSESEYLGLLIGGALSLAAAVGITAFLLVRAFKKTCGARRKCQEKIVFTRSDTDFTPSEMVTVKETTFTSREEGKLNS